MSSGPSGSGLLIDAQLLVLLVVGEVLPSKADIANTKRTRQYDEDAFHILTDFLAGYAKVVVTPHVLTEASNLLHSSFKGNWLRRALQLLASRVDVWDERFDSSTTVVRDPAYLRLGLSDAAIACLSRDALDVLTDDLDLYLELMRRRVSATNFSHLRRFT